MSRQVCHIAQAAQQQTLQTLPSLVCCLATAAHVLLMHSAADAVVKRGQQLVNSRWLLRIVPQPRS